MENLSPENPRNIQKVAADLHARFIESDGVSASQEKRPGPKPKVAREPDQKDMFPPKAEKQILVNAPLDFALQDLDATHPYLADRGFSPDTIAHFGLGFCKRGYLKDRIAIPLHDNDGRLIGYAGRILTDSGFTVDNPK